MQAGDRLGRYEIVGAIGKGGMGEVWRARDTSLHRDVAIKTLPIADASDADRLARFDREAKLLAALKHPNIASIHGLEESNGTRFFVMELVEGGTLASRLALGPSAGRAGAQDRPATGRSARSGPRRGHPAPRSQAREHQPHAETAA